MKRLAIIAALSLVGFAACGDDTGESDTESCDSDCRIDNYWEGYNDRGWELLDQVEQGDYLEFDGVRWVRDPAQAANESAVEAVEIATETGYVCETNTYGEGNLVQINCRQEDS